MKLYRMYVGNEYAGGMYHSATTVWDAINHGMRAVGIEGYTIIAQDATGVWMGTEEATTIVEQYGAEPGQIKAAAQIIAAKLQQKCVLIGTLETTTEYVQGGTL